MTKYIVTTKSNKSTSEFNRYFFENDPSKHFVFEVDYRTGSFALELSKEDYSAVNKDNPNGEFRPFDYDGCELIETYDSWSVFLRFENSTIPEDEQKLLEESFFEDGVDAFEKLGYVFDEAYYVLYGALNFEPIKAQKKSSKFDDAGKDDIAKLFGL